MPVFASRSRYYPRNSGSAVGDQPTDPDENESANDGDRSDSPRRAVKLSVGRRSQRLASILERRSRTADRFAHESSDRDVLRRAIPAPGSRQQRNGVGGDGG